MSPKMEKAESVDAYLAALPDDARTTLEKSAEDLDVVPTDVVDTSESPLRPDT
jgi:hypothetical protein